MADSKQDKHEKALDLTEAALEAMDKGDDKTADRLIADAKKLDPSAPEEILGDLDEAGGTNVEAEDDEAAADEEEEEK